MPGWIAKEKKTNVLNDQKFLEDILWAQYCIFLSVRILDDIYDKQAKDSNLIFVPLLAHSLKRIDNLLNIFRMIHLSGKRKMIFSKKL